MTFAAGRPQMVALDVDGTLHVAPDTDPRAHETITASTRAAVRAVVQSGAHLILCTGRLSLATLPFLRELDVRAGFAICSNGAVLIDAESGLVIEQSSSTCATQWPSCASGCPMLSSWPRTLASVKATDPVEDADMHFPGFMHPRDSVSRPVGWRPIDRSIRLPLRRAGCVPGGA